MSTCPDRSFSNGNGPPPGTPASPYSPEWTAGLAVQQHWWLT